MASYEELYGERQNASLKKKITIALVISANEIISEAGSIPGHALRFTWAKEVIANPTIVAGQVLLILLAKNKDSSIATIQNATDTIVQSAVDSVINLLAGYTT